MRAIDDAHPTPADQGLEAIAMELGSDAGVDCERHLCPFRTTIEPRVTNDQRCPEIRLSPAADGPLTARRRPGKVTAIP
jgi:hypothetical protein